MLELSMTSISINIMDRENSIVAFRFHSIQGTIKQKYSSEKCHTAC
jgi:hypothetical protein